jgi:hypothetical protein
MEAIISRPKADAKRSPARSKVECEATAAQSSATDDVDRPQPPIRRVETPEPGKTHAQLSRVLQFVAQQAGTVNEMLMQMQADPKISYESQVLLGGAKTITQYIGAAADDALGGDISGDFEYWTYGPHFANAGKGGAT